MTANILTAFQGRGVKFWLEGSQLKFAAPRGTLDQLDIATLRHHKQDLISLVLAEIPSDDRPACCCCGGPLPPGRTFRCHSCDVPAMPRASCPCLVNGELRCPTGYLPTESLHDLAVSLGMPPELAARRYIRRGVS